MKNLFILTIFYFAIGCDSYIKREMANINDQVAKDSEERFMLALKGKDPIEICTYAGLVVAAYNQAKNEKKYLEWKETEKSFCKIAGLNK